MESLWHATCSIQPREALRKNLRVDVAVIGGGMAGVLTAYLLTQQGARCVVLEAERIGGGVTGNTTAKVTSQHGLCYDTLLTLSGQETAQSYLSANQAAIERYRGLVREQNIDCGWEDLPSYVYALDGVDRLAKEQRALEQLHFAASLTRKTALPFPVKAALRFERQGQFHPLKFLRHIAQGLEIYEQTPVTDVLGHTAVTPLARVRADRIVVATHYPFINAPGYFFLRMHQERSYVLALDRAPHLDGMYLDANPQGLSFRNAEGCLLLGGAGHRTGENRTGGHYRALSRAANRYFPLSREVRRWSAQDCMPQDSVPFIGRYSPAAPGLYVATGFHKWGMTGSMVAAMLLSDRLTGHRMPWADAFSPHRFRPAASIPALAVDGVKSVKGLSKGYFGSASARLDDIPKGHGGVVRYAGEKLGAYRDENGEVFLVTVKCPHLGCELSWNPDEKTWDCPCHGSRFDYRGNLIGNPAMKGIRWQGKIPRGTSSPKTADPQRKEERAR